MVIQDLFDDIYKNRSVLVTGHTGFKGSWLAYWLTQMGAKVIGYSLEAPTHPSHFELLMQNPQYEDFRSQLTSIIGDINDLEKLNQVFKHYQPEIVFHLAAQSLVRYSYVNPVETYTTNVLGTLKVLEACRKHSVKAIVNITSDKAYENKEWVWGYRENDTLGGYDPYSSSKGCADILANSYRNSFFILEEYGVKHNTLLASCRAGNVIGGGDWAKDRLVVDIIMAASQNKSVQIRNPQAIRPWQHVLEPLSGYLLLGQNLLEGKKEFATAWNFGPGDVESVTVEALVRYMAEFWPAIDYEVRRDNEQPHEAHLLKLDCSKAHSLLQWKPLWNNKKAFKKTVEWYKNYYENGKIQTKEDLKDYMTYSTHAY